MTLVGSADQWLSSLKPNSITTWNECLQIFFQKYFPQDKRIRLRKKILDFLQNDGEELYEAWDRFNELLNDCPTHNVDQLTLIHTFYYALTPDNMRAMEYMNGGDFPKLN